MPLVTFAESGNVYCIVRKDGDKLSATIASKSVGKILDLISEVVNGWFGLCAVRVRPLAGPSRWVCLGISALECQLIARGLVDSNRKLRHALETVETSMRICERKAAIWRFAYCLVFLCDIAKSWFTFRSPSIHLRSLIACVKAKGRWMNVNGRWMEREWTKCDNQMFKCRLHHKHQYF